MSAVPDMSTNEILTSECIADCSPDISVGYRRVLSDERSLSNSGEVSIDVSTELAEATEPTVHNNKSAADSKEDDSSTFTW